MEIPFGNDVGVRVQGFSKIGVMKIRYSSQLIFAGRRKNKSPDSEQQKPNSNVAEN